MTVQSSPTAAVLSVTGAKVNENLQLCDSVAPVSSSTCALLSSTALSLGVHSRVCRVDPCPTPPHPATPNPSSFYLEEGVREDRQDVHVIHQSAPALMKETW